jgi:leucyl-tRNA synthetase
MTASTRRLPTRAGSSWATPKLSRRPDAQAQGLCAGDVPHPSGRIHMGHVRNYDGDIAGSADAGL